MKSSPIRTRGSRSQKRRSFFAGSEPRAASRFQRRLLLESLEDRHMLAASLQLDGPQSLIAGTNVNVSNNAALTQTEMLIDINPTNPLNVAGLSHRVGGGINVELYYSNDGGATWTTNPIVNGVDGFTSTLRADPTITFDADGRLYVAYLVDDTATNTRRIVVGRSSDGGATFDQFSTVDTGTFDGALDKLHLASGLDPSTGNQAVYITYSDGGFDDLKISGSNNGGAAWTTPLIINDQSGSNDDSRFPKPAVGPNGELYVGWHDLDDNQLKFDRDLDGLFGTNDLFGTDVLVANLQQSLFFNLVPAQPERGIFTGPVIDVDRSGGPFDGTVYFVYADTNAGGDDDSQANIYLHRSLNEGDTWSGRILIDAGQGAVPNNSTEFHPWISVDPHSGSVNVSYYTSQGDQAAGNNDVNIRLATSTDGGQTFPAAQQVNLTSATSDATGGYGGDYLEYFGLAVRDGTAHALWSDQRGGAGADQEAFTASASFNATNNVLTITGDDGGVQVNDDIFIRLSAANTNFLEVIQNGAIVFAGLFASIDQIVVNTLFGDDTLTIDYDNGNPIPAGGLSFNGGQPVASDTLVVVGNAGALDNLRHLPTAQGAGTVFNDTFAGPGTAFVNVERVRLVVQQTDGDDVRLDGTTGNDRIEFYHGATGDAGIFRGTLDLNNATGVGPFTLTETSYVGLNGAAADADVNFFNPGGTDRFGFNGTEVNDTIAVGIGDGVGTEIRNTVNGQVVARVEIFNTASAVVRGLDGDDTFTHSGAVTTPVTYEGGDPSASDVLNFNSTGGNVTVNFADSTIQETGFAPVSFIGVETINANVGNADIFVLGTTNNDFFTVTPDVVVATTRLQYNNTTLNANNIDQFFINGVSGDDTLTVNATAIGNTVEVTGTFVDITVPDRQRIDYLNFDDLRVIGFSGNDTFTVTPSATTTIFIDGGDPIGTIPGDFLHVNNVLGSFAGPENDEGGYLTTGQTVSFDHIESRSVTTDANCPFLIVGTNGDDDITIIARDASTHAGADGVQDFTYSINGGPELLVRNAPDLYIDAGSGDDDIVIRAPAPNDADWDVNVRVAGGPPSIGEPNEADRLVLETPGEDSIVFNPTGADTGNIVVDEDGDLAYTAGSTDSIITFGSFVFVCDDPVGDPIEFTYTSSPGGVELVEYDGEVTAAGATIDDITINGTPGDDTTSVVLGGGPGGINTGSFVSTGSPLFNFRSFVDLTANAGSGGFDRVAITATEGADTVTSDNDTVILTGMTVTLSAAIDRLDLNTLGGNDNINLDLVEANPAFAREKVIDAGAGNDIVDLSGALDATIFGGIGDDILIGTPDPDLIFGGAGNDVIIGGGGVDHEYGEDGNDRFGDPAAGDPAGNDPGNDFMFGGDGVDRFVWDPGDGSDVISGGDDGGDILEFHGSAGGDTISLFAAEAAPTHLNVRLGGGPPTVDTAGVEQVIVNTLGGADVVNISDLFTTEVRSVNIDTGVADAAVDVVSVAGRQVSDSVTIRQRVPDLVEIVGLTYDIRITGPEPSVDRLLFFGAGGNDTIVSEDNLSAEYDPEDVVIHGDLGDDFIAGFGVLVGDSGDDTLIGGGSVNTISGDSGNDIIRGGSGADLLFGGTDEDTFLHDFDGSVDTIDGGDDFDTILFSGTSGNDIISANQTADVTLVTTLNGATETDTLALSASVRTVERVKIEAGSGDDVILVKHADALGVDGFVNSVLFDIDGGEAQTRDRLSVQDDGVGDLVLYRKAESDSAGSISVGPGNAESLENVFKNVEFIQPIAGAGGQLLVFKHDPFENNDERINATHLGAGETINVDPTIDPGPLTTGIPDGFQPLPGDQDWYRIVAEKTGTLDFQVYFTMITTVTSGRPGLPNGGNLQLELYDVDGTLIVDGVAGGVVPEFGLNDATNDERIRIPAVEGQTYYLRVFGLDTAINNYNITVVNTPAPTPFDLELDDIIATSAVAAAPAPTATSFAGGAALPNVDDFFNGKDVYFTSGPLNGQRGRVVDYVGATRQFIFAANTFTGAPAVGNTFQIESVDTGRSQLDNITRDNTPTIFIRVPDSALLNDIPDNGAAPGSPPDEVIVIPFVTDTTVNVPNAAVPRSGFRVAVFRTENNTHIPVGFAQPVAGSPGVYSFTFASAIPDGSHFISARVEMIDPASPEQAQGFGAFAQSLEIVVDTQVPPVFFGLPTDPNDGLLPGSDTGVGTNPDTLNDLVTSDTTPGFFGQAEADAVIRLFADVNDNGIFEPAIDFQIGFDVAEPFDGTNQYPTGYWQVDSVTVNLNAPPFPLDGLRRIFVTAEDVAGNINNIPGAGVIQEIEIFIDTQGPQITDVEINEVGNPYDLFDPKPSNDGPTPLVESIVISLRDLPLRTAEFLVRAIKEDIADNPGHYLVTGDYNGIIPIIDVVVTNNPVPNPAPLPGDDPLLATATIELIFWLPGPDGLFHTGDDIGAPLPDDRFTLFVNDEGIIDLAGNIGDFESNADEPHDQDAPFPDILGVDGVPTGDGLPGGDFFARFTIDSRPEVGTWGAGSAWIDTNGNTTFDPTNADYTNRDISYVLGFTSDDLFAGNFALNPFDTADGFDKLAAYGRVGTAWRWLVDTDNDGVPNINQIDPAGINGLPVAGNFDGDATNGDEVGIFTGTVWWFDTNHDFQVDTSLAAASNFIGYPVVGDFDGDDNDDLATWTNDTFQFDLNNDGFVDESFRFGFPSTNERPVAADVNQDGYDDIGLFVPNRTGVPEEVAEWFILVSGEVQNNDPGPAVIGPSIIDRIVTVQDPVNFVNVVRFTPVPFGNDLYIQYGDKFSLPILGNFDPPVAGGQVPGSPGNNPRDAKDVNNDGYISPLDALLVINDLNSNGSRPVPEGGFPRAPYLDVNNDRNISAIDALMVINHLNASSGPAGEGEAPDGFFASLSESDSQSATGYSDEELFALLADDQEDDRE